MAEIPSPQPEPKPVVKSKPQGPDTGRRRLTQFLGLGTGAVIVAANTPPWMRAIAAQEVEPSSTGFGSLPIVEGEQILTETEGKDSLLVNTIVANYRRGPNEDILLKDGLPVYSFFRQSSPTIVNKGGYDWLDTDLLYVSSPVTLVDTNEVIPQGLLEKPLVGSIYTGGVAKATEVKDLVIPQEVADLFRADVELPAGAYSLTAVQAGQLLDALGGGAREVAIKQKMLAAWGDDETQDPKKFVNKWKAAAYIAASAVAEQENKSAPFTVASVTEQDGLLNLFTHIEGERLKVFTRLSADDETVFMVAEGRINPNDPFDIVFENVAPTNWKGLNVLLGNAKAQEVASNTTEIRGNESVELAWEADTLRQAKILLSGMPKEQQFARKLLKLDETAIQELNDRKISSNGEYSYFRDGDHYVAGVQGIKQEDGSTVFLNTAVYMPYAEGADWLVSPEEEDMRVFVDTYADVQGLDKQEVRSSLSYEEKRDVDGNDFTVLLHGDTPLMVLKQGEGESWQEAIPRIVGRMNEKALYPHMAVDGAEDYSNPAYLATAQKFGGLTPSGSFLQQTLENWPEVTKLFVKKAAENGMNMRVYGSFFHGSLKEYFGDRNPSPEEVSSFIDRHIDNIFEVLDLAEGKIPLIEILFANEIAWRSPNGASGWEDSPLYRTYGQNWPVETFVRLYTKAVEKGYIPGNNINFVLNDYGIEIDNGKAQMARNNMATIRAEVSRRLGIPVDEVPMVVGFQFGADFGGEHDYLINGRQLTQMQEDQAIELVANNVRKFAEVVDPNGSDRPVKGTELVTYGASEDEQAAYVRIAVKGLKRSGRADSIGFWSAIRSPYKMNHDASLFDVSKKIEKNPGTASREVIGYKPRKAYYALNSALYR